MTDQQGQMEAKGKERKPKTKKRNFGNGKQGYNQNITIHENRNLKRNRNK
jgi:hypothetical protein